MDMDKVLLLYFREQGTVSVPQIQKHFGFKYSQARETVEKFVESGVLKYTGGIYYQYCIGERQYTDDYDDEDDYEEDELDDVDIYDVLKDYEFNVDDASDKKDGQAEKRDPIIDKFLGLSEEARGWLTDTIKTLPKSSWVSLIIKLRSLIKTNDDNTMTEYYLEVTELLRAIDVSDLERIKKYILKR